MTRHHSHNPNASFTMTRVPTSITNPILLAAYAEFGIGTGTNHRSHHVKNPYARYEYSMTERSGKDQDHDGYRGVDCSALVTKSLRLAGYALLEHQNDWQSLYSTHTFFNGKHVSQFAEKNFDVLTTAQHKNLLKNELKAGDLVLFGPNKQGIQHIGIFSHYQEQADKKTGKTVTKPIFYDAYGSRGPGFSEIDSILSPRLIGVLRVKKNLYVPELDHTQKTNTGLDATSIKLAQGLGKTFKTLNSKDNVFEQFEKNTQKCLSALAHADYHSKSQTPIANAATCWNHLSAQRRAILLEISHTHPELLKKNNFIQSIVDGNYQHTGNIIANEAKINNASQRTLLSTSFATNHLPENILRAAQLNQHLHREISHEHLPSKHTSKDTKPISNTEQPPIVHYKNTPILNPLNHPTIALWTNQKHEPSFPTLDQSNTRLAQSINNNFDTNIVNIANTATGKILEQILNTPSTKQADCSLQPTVTQHG